MTGEAQVNAVPTGPALCALLAALDLPALPDGEAVDVLRASWRQVSHAYAQYLVAMAEVGQRSDPAWAACEIEAALTFTGRRADYEHTFAQMLVRRLPLVLDALRSGAIDHHKARVFADHLADLTDAQIALICARLVPRAAAWTTGQLGYRLLREVAAVDHRHTRRRYQKAFAERGVSGFLAPDGTAGRAPRHHPPDPRRPVRPPPRRPLQRVHDRPDRRGDARRWSHGVDGRQRIRRQRRPGGSRGRGRHSSIEPRGIAS